MNTYMILFGIIVFMTIAFYIISSYSLQKSFIDNDNNNNIDIRRMNDRVRCAPKLFTKDKQHSKMSGGGNKKKPQAMSIYEENMNISNKGFVNELIYRPPVGYSSNIDYGMNKITVPSIPLNDICDTQNLPIANIHVNFLMDKSKESDANLIL